MPVQIFDISRGSDFYGPGGPYEKLAGHDATRALAKMDARMVKEEKDDISDLTPSEKVNLPNFIQGNEARVWMPIRIFTWNLLFYDESEF